MEHSKTLSPSAAHRWMQCPGSVELSKDMPFETNKYADLGTVAHLLGELCLKEGRKTVDYLGKKGWITDKGRVQIGKYPPGSEYTRFITGIDENMCHAVSFYVETVLKDEEDGGILALSELEQKSDVSWVAPGLWGRVDSAIIVPGERIIINDYKNGTGFVEVEMNPQLMIYALGLIGEENEHKVEECILKITQPNVFNAEPVRGFALTLMELKDWANNELRPAAERVEEASITVGRMKPEKWEKIYLKAGDWCLYCKANCQLNRKQQALAMFGDEMALESPLKNPIDLTRMDDDRLFEIYGAIPKFENWLSAVKAKVYHRLKMRGATHGYKLIPGYGHRSFSDEKRAASALRNYISESELYEVKMKSPSKVETLLKLKKVKPEDRERILEGLVIKPERDRSKIVPITHKTPALPPAVDTMFEEDDLL